MAPTLTRGVHPKRAPWQCPASLLAVPPPRAMRYNIRWPEVSPASRVPPPTSCPQTIGELPPPVPALAASTSLFTPCRGSGVASSHVSREPGAPGWAAPRGAGPWWPSQGSRGWYSQGAFLPAPLPGVSALPAHRRWRGAREPLHPSQSQLHVRNRPLGPQAAPPFLLLLRPAPRGSIFSALASFRRCCLARNDVMPTAPRFPRERGALRRAWLGRGDSAPGPSLPPATARVGGGVGWGVRGETLAGPPDPSHGSGPLCPLYIRSALLLPRAARVVVVVPPPAQARQTPGPPHLPRFIWGALPGAAGARRCFLLAAHNARASRRSACAQQ